MKLNIVFGLVVMAVMTQQGESSALESPALKSSIRDEIVLLLKDVNGLVSQLSNDVNDYLLGRLQNETQIKEWSVDIQVKVNTGIASLVFYAFDAYKEYVVSKYGSAIEEKILTCVSDQEADLLEAVRDGSTQFGWCNNRLAANLTVAFQKTSQSLVDITNTLDEDLTSLSGCILGDDLCFSAFLVKVVALVREEVDPTADSLVASIADVARVYSIMFGQDVPRCNGEYLTPIVLKGVETAVSKIAACNALP